LASEFSRQLVKRLKDEAVAIENAVMTGVCEDYPSYRYEIGRVRGILFAIETLEEMEDAALAASEDF
jgi:hypothetical protein